MAQIPQGDFKKSLNIYYWQYRGWNPELLSYIPKPFYFEPSGLELELLLLQLLNDWDYKHPPQHLALFLFLKPFCLLKEKKEKEAQSESHTTPRLVPFSLVINLPPFTISVCYHFAVPEYTALQLTSSFKAAILNYKIYRNYLCDFKHASLPKCPHLDQNL